MKNSIKALLLSLALGSTLSISAMEGPIPEPPSITTYPVGTVILMAENGTRVTPTLPIVAIPHPEHGLPMDQETCYLVIPALRRHNADSVGQ